MVGETISLFAIGTFLVKVGALAILAGGALIVADKIFAELAAGDGSSLIDGAGQALSATESLRQIENLNQEVRDLERKRLRDGRLSRNDDGRMVELAGAKRDLFVDYQHMRRQELYQNSKGESLIQSQISPRRSHLMSWHTGQIIVDKRCACGRPMFLQHRNVPSGSPGLRDFFWSCVGYFDSVNQCNGLLRLQRSDMALLHRNDVEEFHLPSQEDLSVICGQRGVEQRVNQRMRTHLKNKDAHLLCPVHLVPMKLREKRTHKGVTLDRYFLGCQNYPACTQLRKLKSWAQLASFLHRKEGVGILEA